VRENEETHGRYEGSKQKIIRGIGLRKDPLHPTSWRYGLNLNMSERRQIRPSPLTGQTSATTDQINNDEK